jgi:hypothetical protein
VNFSFKRIGGRSLPTAVREANGATGNALAKVYDHD